MKKRVLILGAGFAGLELATRLSESAADELEVTLIDRNEAFSFGFSKLEVMFGRRTAEEIRLPYDAISKEGVEFRRESVTSIDPAQRRVTTDGGSYEGDFLVIAMGADCDIGATPGLRAGGVEFYSVAGAARTWEAIQRFESGRILIGILGQPFKCPPAPFEGALLLHDHYTGRGTRDSVEIEVVGPMAAPVPVTKEVSKAFQDALSARDIHYRARALVTAIDPDRGEAMLESGESLTYDLFIGIPVHRVPEVVASSGLAEDGWVGVDRANLRTDFDGVYAVGDVAGTPNAKAGVFAESAAGVVADGILSRLRGRELERSYEGAGSCYLEVGHGEVAKVEANFFGGPEPRAALIGPSKELAAEKREFAGARRARWFGL